MSGTAVRKAPIIGTKGPVAGATAYTRAPVAAQPTAVASPPRAAGVAGANGATRSPTPTRAAGTGAPATSDDIEQKKRAIAQRLQEKEKRLSRLSMALGSGAAGGSTKQQEVEQLADKLRKMQSMLDRSEKVRKHEEAEEQRRVQEERAMHRLTQDLEKSAPAGALSKSQKNRRTQNMMTLMRESNGKLSEEKLQALEAKENEQDERERLERKNKMEHTERKLKEVNDKIRDQAKAREEQNVLKLQKQLEFMENKLKELEGGGGSSKGAQQEEEDDDQNMRDWEEKMRALRQERERALNQRKLDMNRRLQELQGMVEAKKAERADLQNSAKEKRIRDLEKQMENLDNDNYQAPASGGGGGGGGGIPGLSQDQLEKWMQQMVEQRMGALEQKMKADHEAAMQKKTEEMKALYAMTSDPEAILKKLSQVDGAFARLDIMEKKIAAGFTGGGGGVELTMTYDEIIKEIQKLQQIIFDANSTEQQTADANIQLEKVMQQLEQTDEYRKEKADKQAAMEKLNKEALERVKNVMRGMTPDQLKRRLTDNPELKLVLMEQAQIGKLHQNDFKGFAMRGLTLDEVRAVRGACPTFRKDQKIQQEWQESIEAKIDDLAQKALAPPPPKPAKKAKAGLGWKKPKAAPGGSSGDMFAQIKARAKKQSGEEDEPEEPAKPATPNVAVVAGPPPPGMKKPPPLTGKPPPPPLMGKPPPPPVFAPPPPAPGNDLGKISEQRENEMRAKANAAPVSSGSAVSADDIKSSADQLHNMVFSGVPEGEIVNRLKILSEQIKLVAGDHKELPAKARFLIMAVKEAIVSRNGTPNEVNHSKQKLSVVVNSLKRALD